jgi:hypothetical protein
MGYGLGDFGGDESFKARPSTESRYWTEDPRKIEQIEVQQFEQHLGIWDCWRRGVYIDGSELGCKRNGAIMGTLDWIETRRYKDAEIQSVNVALFSVSYMRSSIDLLAVMRIFNESLLAFPSRI